MTDLTLRFNLLESAVRKLVLDFLDFLLLKEAKTDVPKYLIIDYKQIQCVSIWSEPEIDLINQYLQNLK